MSDHEVKGKVTIFTKDAVDSFRDLGEKVEHATHGIGGNLDALSSALSHFSLGTVAALGAVGLAFEGIREAIHFNVEAVETMFKITEQFEQLKETTGASLEELTKWDAAMKMTGGNLDQLRSWMVQSTRAIRMNADVLIANGVAHSKAELMAMPFEERLKKIVHAAEQFEEPGRRQDFLISALGRSAGMSFPQLKKFIEAQDEAKKATEGNLLVTEKMIEAQKAHEIEVGKTELAYQNMIKAMSGDGMKELLHLWREFKNTMYETVEIYFKAGMDIFNFTATADAHFAAKRKQIVEQALKDMEATEKKYKEKREAERKEEEKKHTAVTKQELEQRRALGVESASHRKRLTDIDTAYSLQAIKDLVEQHKVAIADEVAEELRGLEQRHAAEMKEVQAQAAAAGSDLTKQATAANKKAELNKKYWADRDNIETSGRKRIEEDELAGLKRVLAIELDDAANNLERQLDLHRAFQVKLNAMKYSTLDAKNQEALEIQKLERQLSEENKKIALKEKETKVQIALDGVEGKRRALELEKEWGLVTVDAEIEQLRYFAEQERTLEQERAAAKRDANKNQKEAWAEYWADLAKIENEFGKKLEEAEKQRWQHLRDGFKSMLDGWETGLSTLLQGLMKGAMTWSQFTKNIFQGIGNAMLKLGMDELSHFLMIQGKKMALWLANKLTMTTTDEAAAATAMATAKTEGASEIMAGAGEYAVNAAASVAAIPFYGWAMAPGVFAEAMATGLSALSLLSGAGGIERVPNDTLAMIHKDESVIPASYAEGLRSMIANGSTGGQQIHFHVNTMDAKGVDQFLKKHATKIADTVSGRARDFHTRRI